MKNIDYTEYFTSEEDSDDDFYADKTFMSKYKQEKFDELANANVLTDEQANKIANLDYETYKQTVELTKYKICKVYDVKNFDGDFAKEALKLIKVQPNVKSFYLVSNLDYLSEDFNIKIDEVINSVLERTCKDSSFLDDVINNANNIRLMNMSKLCLILLFHLKQNKDNDVFINECKVNLSNDVKELLIKYEKVIFGYYCEDSTITDHYKKKQYLLLLNLILGDIFGLTIVNNVIISRFKYVGGKFRPKKGLYVSADDKCFCNNKANSRCGRCNIQHYCSKECQKLDWKNHSKLCPKI